MVCMYTSTSFNIEKWWYIYRTIDAFNKIDYLLSKYCWLFDDLLSFFLYKSLWIQASAKSINVNVFNPISCSLYYSRYIPGRTALCYIHPSMTMECEVMLKYRERAKARITHMSWSLSTLINPEYWTEQKQHSDRNTSQTRCEERSGVCVCVCVWNSEGHFKLKCTSERLKTATLTERGLDRQER